MKQLLPEKSKEHEARIKEIAEIIVNSAKDKIAFVILFGSFARGTWMHDKYTEDGVIYEYASDYDFLIITKTAKQASGNSGFEIENKIKRQIKNVGYLDLVHKTHVIIEPLDRVNGELERAQYFFHDIKKEGILLYDSGEFTLSEPRNLNEAERRQIAKEDYTYWMNNSLYFISHCLMDLENEVYNKAAFQLHQATESLYNCTLITLSGYKPKSHDLIELNQLCSIHSNKFLTIFPLATEAQKESFKLLQKAYIDARYKKSFKISKEQLEYLVERVEELKKVVEGVCEAIF